MTRRRAIFLVIFALVALLPAVLYLLAGSPFVLDRALETARGAGVKLDLAQVRGNLLDGRLEAEDLKLALPGVSGSAGKVKVSYSPWALLQRQVRLRVSLEGANITIDPSKFGAGAGGEAPPVSVILEAVDLKDSRVSLDGRAWFIPNVSAVILEQTPDADSGQDGKGLLGSLRAKLSTPDGAGLVIAKYKVAEDGKFKVDLEGDLDVRIARFWFDGIQAGRLAAKYTISSDSFFGEGIVSGGVVEALPGLIASQLSGTVKHTTTGHVIGKLTGVGLEGPVTANVDVNIPKERWDVTGQLEPKLGLALAYFFPGVTGSGRSTVTVRGGGWADVKLEGELVADGEVVGLPVRGARGTWTARVPNKRGEPQFVLDVNANAATQLFGGRVNVAAKVSYADGRATVDAAARGKVLARDLKLISKITTGKTGVEIAASGDAFGGGVNAKATILDSKMTGAGNFENLNFDLPLEHALSGRFDLGGKIGALEAKGDFSRAKLIVPGVRAKDWPGSFVFRQVGSGIAGDLDLKNGSSSLTLKGDLARGKIVAGNVQLEPGGLANVSASYDLSGKPKLEGQARLREIAVGGFSLDDIAGPWQLAFNDGARGGWSTPQLILEYTGNQLKARTKSWQGQFFNEAITLSGGLEYGLQNGLISGLLRGDGRLGQVSVTGRGKTLELGGDLRYQSLRAKLDGVAQLQPFSLQASSVVTSNLDPNLRGVVKANLERGVRVSGQVFSAAKNPLNLSFTDGQFTARGGLDLRTLEVALPPELRGQFAGVADLDVRGSSIENAGGTAQISGRYGNFPVSARVGLNAGQVTTDATLTGGDWRGARVIGVVYPKLNARVSYRDLSARVSGLANAFDFSLRGQLPELPIWQAQNLELLRPDLDLNGRFENATVTANGRVGNLNVSKLEFAQNKLSARYSGDLNVRYAKESIQARGLEGDVRVDLGEAQGVKLAALISQLEGSFSGQKFNSSGLDVRLNQKDGLNIAGSIERLTARILGQDIRANGLELKAFQNTQQNNGWQGSGNVARLETRIPGQASGQLTRLVDVDLAASSVDGQLTATARAGRGVTGYGALKAWLEPVTVGITGSITDSIAGKNSFEITASAKLEGQALTESFGGSFSGRAAFPFEASKWDADVRLNLQGNGWNLNANGPLENARVFGRMPSRFLALAGVSVPREFLAPVAFDAKVNARELTYRGSLNSTLESGYRLNATVNGKRERFNAALEALDSADGWARLNYSSGASLGLKTGSGTLEASGFDLEPYVGSAVQLDANLNLNRDRLEGSLQTEVAGLPIQGNWRNGGFTGSLGGSVPLALRTGSWRFPLEVAPFEWKTTSSDLPFDANGILNLVTTKQGLLPRAEGEVRLKPFGVDVPGGRAQLEPQPIKLAAQFRTTATNTGLELTLTSPENDQPVRFTKNRWQGNLAMPYSLWDSTGNARVTLEGPFENRSWTDPNFKLETDGPLQANASGTLEDWTANAKLDLNGIQGDLSEDWRTKIKPGLLEVNATGSILPELAVEAKLSNLETSVDGQGVNLEASASYEANEWRADGELQAMMIGGNLTSGKDSSANFRAGNDGAWLELNRLDLGLLRAFGLEASGTATGRISLPEWTGERIFGAVQLEQASTAGVTATGQLEVNAGQFQGNLNGALPGDFEYQIDGAIAPKLDATIAVDGLRGTALGRINLSDVRQSQVTLEAVGEFFKRKTNLRASLNSTQVQTNVTWDAVQLTANARWLNEARGLNRVNALLGTGRLEVSDLRGLAGIEGKLSSDLSFENLNVLARNLRANVAGFDVAASASFDGLQVSASEFRAEGQGLKANGAGLVWPKLDLGFQGSSNIEFVPGEFTGRARGSIEKPLVNLDGVLSAAKVGLNADGTALTARLENDTISLALSGPRLSGTARANLKTLSGEEPLRALEAFDLHMDTELLSPSELPIAGMMRWDSKTGFVGRLEADGKLLESQALASLEGRAGRLEAVLNWRNGILRANLPGRIERALEGDLQLERFDLGALWGRPERLRLQADGQLSGSWLEPRATMRGTLEDVRNEFTSALELGYAAGLGSLDLTGPHLRLNGNVDGKGWKASGQTTSLRFDAELLPDSFKLPEVQFGVTTTLEASQQFSNGANGLKIRATNLRAVGALEPIGDFELAGSADLNGNRLNASAKLRALEGEVSFDGRLGLAASSLERLNISARGISLERFGLAGLVAGTANLNGTVSDPNVQANLNLERFGPRDQDWWANAIAKLDGRLLDPNVQADLQLAGTGSGRSSVRIRDLFKPAPVIAWQGAAGIPGIKLEGILDGPWPLLNGNATLSLDGAPEVISSLNLNARAGVLDVSSRSTNYAPMLLGQVKLVPGSDLGDIGLDGKLRLNTKLEAFTAGANGSITGDLLVTGRALEPELKLIALASKLDASGFVAPDMKLEADFKLGSPLTAHAQFEGGEAKLEAGLLSLNGLKLSGSAFDATIQARGQVLNGLAFDPDLRFDANLSGILAGKLRGTYLRDIRAVDLIGLQLDGSAYGTKLLLDARASSLDGWTGDLNVTGLPALAPKIPGITPETTDPNTPSSSTAGTPAPALPVPGSITATLDGEFAAPTLNGTGLIAGSGVRVQAQLNPLTATFGLETLPGQTAQSKGSISLKDGSLSGKLEYALENLKLALVASGSLERPAANVSVKRETLSANADLQLNAGKIRGDVSLSDGQNTGTLKLENDRLTGRVPLLDLGAFGLEGFDGQVGLETDLALSANLSSSNQAGPNLAGRANLVWKNLRTPFEVPALGFRIDGTGTAEIDPETSSLTFSSEGTPGAISGAFSWREVQPSGSARLSLRGPGGRGAIVGEVALARGNLTGRAQAANLDLSIMGLKVAASGNVTLDGLEFNATGQAQALGGRITLSELGGNLEEYVPGLSTLLGRAASTEEALGLRVQARLDGVKLEEVAQFKAALPNATGRVSGVVGFSGEVVTFGLTVPQLHLPTQKSKTNQTGETNLRLRVSGTAADGNVRYRGEFDGAQGFETGTSGSSTFNGDLTNGVLSGKLELRHAPVHALLGSVVGTLPGIAFVTGGAKYSVPLEKLTQGRVELIAESLELAGGGAALRGTLAAVYDKGGLILNKLALDGAGSWRGAGRYGPDGVDLKLSFQDTTFTPVLGLIPNLRDLNPSATGSVQLEFSGAYDKPNAILQASNIAGSIAGIELASQAVSGTLQNGALELVGVITSGGAVGGSLSTTANANVTSYSPIKIENLRAKANGSVTVAPIGKLENVIAEIGGESGGFELKAKGTKGGAFTIEGPLSDRLDLKLKGQNLEIALPDFFIKDGLVDADLRMVQEGRQYRVTGDIAASRITSSTSIPRPEKTDQPTKAQADTPNPSVPLLKRIELDRVRLTAPNGVRFTEPNLNLALEAGGILTMTGTLGEPKIAGTLEALERSDRTFGSFNFAGFAYSIQEGKAAFNPLDGIYPTITARGRTRIKIQNPRVGQPESAELELRVTLRFRSQPGGVLIDADTKLVQFRANGSLCPTDPNPQFDPDCLSQAEALGLIALGNGNDFNDPAKLATGISTGALNQLLNAFVLREFSNAFTQATGVSFNISTNAAEAIVSLFSSDEKNRKDLTLKFSIGGYINRAFYLEAFLGTAGNNGFALTWTSEDNLFGIRYYQPLQFNANSNVNNNLFGGSEVRLSYNLSRNASINFGLSLGVSDNSTKFSIGGAWRF